MIIIIHYSTIGHTVVPLYKDTPKICIDQDNKYAIPATEKCVYKTIPKKLRIPQPSLKPDTMHGPINISVQKLNTFCTLSLYIGS